MRKSIKLSVLTALVVAAVMIFAVACGGSGNDDTPSGNVIAVTGVTLGTTTHTMAVGEDLALVATVAPANATNRNMSWTSASPNIVSVNNLGVVRGEAPGGPVLITVTTADGDHTATANITVTPDVIGIYTVADFLAIGSNLGGSFYLGANLDLSSATNFQGFGTDVVGGGFTGTFDGRGRTISGLNIDRGSQPSMLAPQLPPFGVPYWTSAPESGWVVGIFRRVDASGTIRNLSVANSSVRGTAIVGGLVGVNAGTIDNCLVEVNVASTYWYPSGTVVGFNELGGTITNTISRGNSIRNIGVSNGLVFGFVGRNWGVIDNCLVSDEYLESVYDVVAGNFAGDGDGVVPATNSSIVTDAALRAGGAIFAEFNTTIWNFAAGQLPALRVLA